MNHINQKICCDTWLGLELGGGFNKRYVKPVSRLQGGHMLQFTILLYTGDISEKLAT